MKITDDRSAKLKAWAKSPGCVRLPCMTGNPVFKPQNINELGRQRRQLGALSGKTAGQSGFFWTGLTGFTGLMGILNRQDAKSAKADFIRRVKRRINYSSSDMQVNVRGKPREHILRLAYLAP